MIRKTFFNSTKKKQDFFNEIEILQSLQHPFIAGFFAFFESSNSYNIVMEYLPNGTLHDFITKNIKLDESIAKRLFIQLITVLDYLHNEKHIVHRDLKPKNIMLDKNYNIRVIIFGLSKNYQSDHSMLYTKCVSLISAPPEMISGQPYNAKCDIWSSGIILYMMICGKLPFDGKNQNDLFRKILNNEPIYEEISTDLANLIQQHLKKNSNDRISLSDIQKHRCLQFLDYKQFLKSTITQLMKLSKKTFMKNYFDDHNSKKYLFIENQILFKEQITDFLECLNPIKFDNLRSNQLIEMKTQTINRIKSQPNIGYHRNNESTDLVLNTERSKNNILKNRRIIIQHTITSAQHAPILSSATTGISIR
jgi:serine/threonine protein kinase